MPVYVDNARIPYGRMLMSHLLADTEDELLAMADRIRLNRRHYQKNGRWPHFDVCAAYRERAIAAGAIPVTRRELGVLLRRLRQPPSIVASDPKRK